MIYNQHIKQYTLEVVVDLWNLLYLLLNVSLTDLLS